MSEITLIEFYKQQLISLGLTVTDAGQVLKPNGKPVTIAEKEMWLPTNELLKANDWSNIHPYHPLCEDVLLGQSDTIHFLTKAIKTSITTKFCELMAVILTVAKDPELQSAAADPKIHDVLRHCNGATKTVVDDWLKLVKMFASKDNMLVNLTVHVGKEIDNKRYHRVCTAHFPIMEDREPNAQLLGKEIGTSDKRAIRQLFAYVVGLDVEQPMDSIQIGSNENRPYYHVLMSMYQLLAARINVVAKLFAKVCNVKQIPLKWAKQLNSLADYDGLIVELPGNAGTPTKSKQRQVTVPDTLGVFSDDFLDVPKRDNVETHTPAKSAPAATAMPQSTGSVPVRDLLSAETRLGNDRGGYGGGYSRSREVSRGGYGGLRRDADESPYSRGGNQYQSDYSHGSSSQGGSISIRDVIRRR